MILSILLNVIDIVEPGHIFRKDKTSISFWIKLAKNNFV